jgi:DNA helicase IV
MKDVKLLSGRKVKIKNMTINQIDECKDIPELVYKDGETASIRNVYKARTAWLRCGIGGGDFDDYGEVNEKALDNVLKQLTDDETEELVNIIQTEQILEKKAPSS